MAEYGARRLIEEQSAALRNTEEQIQQWNKFKEDYSKLKTKIGELPDQVSYDYMVPFGPMAFMPGKLIHTNEVLVLLGDNWFAEVSAKHSCDIIDRRLTNIEQSLEKLSQQKKLLESRTTFTQEEFSKQEIDITEKYDSDEDRKWREAHKKRVRKEKLAAKGGGCNTEGDVISKLEELHLREMMGHEMTRPDDDTDQSNSKVEPMGITKSKTVHWENEKQLKLPVQENSGSSDSSIDSDDSVAAEPVIHFKHSPRSGEGDRTPSQEEGARISSPSDIYRLYSKPKTKSILKQERSFEEVKSRSYSTDTLATARSSVKFSKPQQQTAIQDHVVERTPSEVKAGTADNTSAMSNPMQSSITSQPQQPAPRISKFKAMRQRQRTS